MTQAKPSRSAQNVALVRANLTRFGIVDDPHARQMLSPDRRRTAALFRLPGVRFRIPGVRGLAARTLCFDSFLNAALDDGLRQVAIVDAGYDSRAWRLARPDVTFFEVDRPATRRDKQAKAPEGGPVYVSADVAYYKRAGEPWRFRLSAEDAPSFLAEAGWTLSSLLTGADLDKEHLTGTKLAGKLSALNSPSFVAVAKK